MLHAEWSDSLVAEAPTSRDAMPFWSRSDVLAAYERAATVTVRRDASVVGLWHLPLSCDDAGLHVRRPARLTPYCAPWLAAGHVQRRRRVAIALLEAVQQHVRTIDVPMAPGFVEVTGCANLGIEAVWRHTRIVPREDGWRRRYSEKARNQVRAGRQAVAAIRVDRDPCRFDFDRGVVEGGRMRARFAERLSEWAQVRCLSAFDRDGSRLGQAFVVADATTAYLMHSWFDRSGPRGVPSVLVDAAITTSFEELGATQFDFEGSVLPGVDEFMSGFGGDVCPYPHLRWFPAGVTASAELA